ncbi:hypothetical protein [Bermanella sp. R86510]|uniref:Nmad3 family putative nucleotide modification protein n=1 Tax=unclassified Bermanella TaxID=2627862 RepID=UPI0037C776CE
MRIILSRKGFDSSAGGCPNPILPDGRLLPLPIPDDTSIIRYQDLDFENLNIGTLVKQLTMGKIKPRHGAHLDPDMFSAMLVRNNVNNSQWQANLGQAASAQGHLQKQGVQVGDIFLFFAVSQPIEKVGRAWQFIKGTKPRHIIWGYLQIGEILKLDDIRDIQQYQWLSYHPHWQYSQDALNTLYLAKQHLNLEPFVSKVNKRNPLSGAGVFPYIHKDLTLSVGKNLTEWQVPSWMYPFTDDTQTKNRPPLSYHTKPWRWQLEDNQCFLKAAARGQEFVLQNDYAHDAIPWLYDLFHQHTGTVE